MENVVSGKVLVKETDIGIPNLVVVAYDAEPSKIKRIDVRSRVSATSSAFSGFWSQFPGTRLGSVNTNRNGEFEIRYEYESNKQTNTKTTKRPNLALFVSAPEEPDSTIKQQILYYSKEIREKAGKLEKYIIKIPKTKLDSENIPYPNPEDVSLSTKSIKTKIENSIARDQTIKDNLNLQISKRYQLFDKFYKKSKDSLKNFSLSSLSSEERASPTFLDQNDDLKKNQSTIIERSFKKISEGPNLPINLSLSDSDLADLDLKLNPDKSISGSVIYNKIHQRFKDVLIEALDLTVKPSPFDACKKKLDIDEKIEKIKNPSPNISPDGEDPNNNDISSDSSSNTTKPCIEDNEEELTTKEFIKKRAIYYMNNSPLLFQSSHPEIANADNIISALSNFKLSPGPADVASYHDFYSLQFSFESVKTEVYDETIKSSASKFFTEFSKFQFNKLANNSNESNSLISTISDLTNTIADAMKAAASIVSADYSSISGLEHITPTEQEWNILTPEEQARIFQIDKQISELITERDSIRYIQNFGPRDPNQPTPIRNKRSLLNHEIEQLKLEAQRIIDTVVSINNRIKGIEDKIDILSSRKSGISLISDLNQELQNRLKQPYKFDIFAPNSVNFGLLVNYRQKWDPLNYQVGELVSTIPLAPKEVRKYTKKQVVKKRRSEKEIETSIQSVKEESQDTSRAEAEIIDKTETHHSFKLSVSPRGLIKKFADVSSEYSFDKKKLSQQTKKSFRESVRKAAQEYKNEHKLEISTEESFESEQIDSSEISNPNDELPVTYLFYELQRRYRISEKIHKVTPVIMVANKVPKPNEIDEDWLVAHDWILKRSILDDSFLEALNSLKTISNTRIAIKDLEAQIITQENTISELQLEINKEKALVIYSREELTNIQEETTDEKKIDNVRDIYERNERKLQEIASRLDIEVKTLHKLQSDLSEMLRKYSELSVSISRLQIHVKSYILHYMQAIWNYEPSDQRFFRLYDIKVPWFDGPKSSDDIPIETKSTKANNFSGKFSFLEPLNTKLHSVGVFLPTPSLPNLLDLIPYRKLGEIANLDKPLGYFGNYTIFPLREINYLLTFMMKDYVDLTRGDLVDPDEEGDIFTEDMVDYINCLYEKNPDSFKDPDWEQFKDILLNHFNPNEHEEIIVPTDSLYIEALPGSHPILENFKMEHRAVDVDKVKSELIKSELENVRYAARLMSGKHEDPETDKQILISGDKKVQPVVDVDDNNNDT